MLKAKTHNSPSSLYPGCMPPGAPERAPSGVFVWVKSVRALGYYIIYSIFSSGVRDTVLISMGVPQSPIDASV